MLIFNIALLVLARVGDTPQLRSQVLLAGGRQAAGIWLLNTVPSIFGTLQFFFLVFLFRALLRHWVAAALFVALYATMNSLRNPHPEILAPVWVLIYSIAAYAVSRFGLITLALGILSVNVLANLPYTLDFSKWYAADTFFVLLSFVLIAAWAFYTSVGRNLIREDLLQ